jgi:hypothetical protein
MIAIAGCIWHFSVSRDQMLQQLSYLTVENGGVYAHWDALEGPVPP